MTARGALVDRCDNCGAWLRPMTPGQHAAVEAIYRDLSAQVDYPRGSGQKWTPFEWHQIMLGLFMQDQGLEPKFVPGLTGKGIIPVTAQKQSRLTKKQGSDLIEFASALAADFQVKRTASRRELEQLA